jgi:hypothetical protein
VKDCSGTKISGETIFLDVKKLDGGPSRQVIRLRHSVRRISVKSVVSVVCVFSEQLNYEPLGQILHTAWCQSYKTFFFFVTDVQVKKSWGVYTWKKL